LRSRPRIPLEDIQAELLPDVTRRCGRQIIYSSAEDRLAMEKLWRVLQRQQAEVRLAA
jgi:hypothetical protein